MCFRLIQLGTAKTLVLLFLVLNPDTCAIEHTLFDNILKWQPKTQNVVQYQTLNLDPLVLINKKSESNEID